MYQLNHTKTFIKKSKMITTVLMLWRQQESIQLITFEREGEQEHKRKIKEHIAEHKRDVKLKKQQL